MNMHNFKIFIEALEALPEDVKSNKFHHLGMDEPELNKPHDFGGLISIVAVNIDGLPQIYQKILKYHRAHNPHCKETYNSNIWLLALVEYLGEYWGEYWGDDFGKSEDEILTHNEIIAHLRGMYEKLKDK